VLGNSLTYDFAALAPCQMIFVDGAHDENSARSDTDHALSIVDRDNGVIVWHDATIYGVRSVTGDLIRRGMPLRLVAGTDVAVLRFRDGQPADLSE
jgi:hypothetical protein